MVAGIIGGGGGRGRKSERKIAGGGGGGGTFFSHFLSGRYPLSLSPFMITPFTKAKHVANIVLTSKCCFLFLVCFPFVSKCHLFYSTKFCSHYSSAFLMFAIVLLLFSLPSLASMVLYCLSLYDLLSCYKLNINLFILLSRLFCSLFLVFLLFL